MDISNIKPVERLVEIKHPATGEDLGIRVTLLSINDERMKKLKKRIQDERMRLETRGKSFKADDIEDNRIALVSQAITGWDWYGENVNFHGEKPAFTPANVKKVLSEPSMYWFHEQLEGEISDEQAFFQTSK